MVNFPFQKYNNESSDNSKTIVVKDFNSISDHIIWLNNNRVHKINKKLFPSRIVKIDFHHCRFLKPYHIAPLACLIHEYQTKGYIIKLINIPSSIQDYLESFHFDQFCKTIDKRYFPDPTDSKTLPLWCIEQSGISLYPIQAQLYFENNHFDGKSLFALSSSLAELMNNVFDHSESKIPGYTFTQYNSTKNQIITCVCDFGIGIPNSVNKFLKKQSKPPLDNLSALIKSFTLEFSTKSKPHNRGFGWDNIFSIIKALNSQILIISYNTLFWSLNNGETKKQELPQYFPGTSVIIYLDTDNLPQKEEELSDELMIL